MSENGPTNDLPVATTRERLSALLGNRRKTVAMLAIASILSGFTEAGILALLAQIAYTAANSGGHNKASHSLLHFSAPVTTLFLIAVGLTLLRTVLQVPLSIMPSKISSDVQARLRNELFGAFTKASWEVQASDKEGHLQETLTSQVLQATGGAQQATALVIAVFSFLVLMGSAIALNALAALVILVAAVILFGALRPLNRLGARRAKELSRAQLNYAGGVNEASRLAEDTHVFGAGGAQQERVGDLIAIARDLFFKTQLVGRLSPTLYQSAIYLILVGGLFALYETGAASHFVSLGAVVLIIVRAGTYGQMVQGSYQSLRQSLPFIERLQLAQHRYAASEPPSGDEDMPRLETLAFDDVAFSYSPDRPVLSHISFEVHAGEAVGVIGPSGAGKSTLIQVLLRLREPQEGRYLINGLEVGLFRRSDWRRRVSYVSQQPRLLHASVADNISFLRDIERDEVERAGKLARIHDEIMAWPEGYDTIVGPRVDAVSGGQQQRICLARALAGRPEVLVLDEPTSALDPHSEQLIQESLTGLRHELTLFIIAHRMSTLDICDRVMVIIGGRLVAFDSTDLLQQSNDYYRSASMIATGASGGVLP